MLLPKQVFKKKKNGIGFRRASRFKGETISPTPAEMISCYRKAIFS